MTLYFLYFPEKITESELGVIMDIDILSSLTVSSHITFNKEVIS